MNITVEPLYYALLLELELTVYNIFERDNRDIEIVSDGVRNIIHIRGTCIMYPEHREIRYRLSILVTGKTSYRFNGYNWLSALGRFVLFFFLIALIYNKLFWTGSMVRTVEWKVLVHVIIPTSCSAICTKFWWLLQKFKRGNI